MRKEGESTTMRINHQKFRLAFDNASYEGKDIGVSRTRYKKKKKRKKKTNKKRQEKQNSSQATTVETQPCSF